MKPGFPNDATPFSSPASLRSRGRRRDAYFPLLLVAIFALLACQKPHPSAPAPETLRADGPSPAQRRAEEAKWLARYPEVATRDGPTLIVRHDGAEVARYVDDPKGCNPYSVSKVIRLYDQASGGLQPVAEVTCRFGPIDNRYLVLPSSDKYTVRDDVTASPDGRMLAMADNALGPTGGQFALIDWPSLTRVAVFKAGCRDIAWRDAGHIDAVCWHNDGSSPHDPDDSRSVVFTAELTRGADGRWTMTGTRFVGGAAGHALPRLAGETPPPDRP